MAKPSSANTTPVGMSSGDTDLSDILGEEARAEALSFLAVPTGSSSDFGGFTVKQAQALSALDLTLPEQVRTASTEQLKGKGLGGYESLKRMKDESSRYRLAYSGWRKGAPRGAKGEAVVDTLLQAAPAAAPVPMPPRAKGSARMKQPPSATNLSQLPAAVSEHGEVLTLEYGNDDDADEEVADSSSRQGSWLKFAFNPYSETAEVGERTPLALCEANLRAIEANGARNLSVPAAGSRVATSHIAHIGVGGFHRSHLAFVTDRLRQLQHAAAGGGGASAAAMGGDDEAWGIIGVGLMPWDKKMADVLKKQDGLYALLLRGNSSASARVVGSLLDFLFVPDAPEASLARLCAPSVKIVSLTVTEKGYYRTIEGDLDVKNPLVREDIDGWKAIDGGRRGLAQPKTAFGLICTVLQRRRADGLGPLTVFSCDNLPMNGSVCRAVTLRFAREVDASLAAWMERHVTFPNSMVDRITPATEPEHRQLLREEYGIEDEWPVIAEPFLQWVIEDDFAAGRPAWERAMPADVLVTSNVEPYELMKLRLLNSSHSALSYAAMLCEHKFVDDALADPDVFAYLRAYMSEVVKTLGEVQGVDLNEYQRSLLERFSNVFIKDRLARLAQDGSQKFMNTLRDALLLYRTQLALMSEMTSRSSWIAPADKNVQDGTTFVALALAAFMRYVDATDEATGAPLPLDDPLAEQLRPHAAAAFRLGEGRPEAVSRAERLDATRMFVRTVFGAEVAAWDAFVGNVFAHAERIQRTSCREVLRQCRHEQLRVIRADAAECEARLRELQRAEQLLTTPSEKDAAMRFFTGQAKPSKAISRRETFSN